MSDVVLTAGDIPGYVAGRPTLRGLVDADTLTVTEVGDGNLNLVFICVDAAGRRVVLKQALPYVRLVGPEWPMTEMRAAREASALTVHGALSEHVCRLLDFDEEHNVLVLEDLSDHEVFRSRLNAGGAHDGIVERLSEYVADVAFGTSFLTLTEEEFRLRAAAAANPELCAISEALVFTEPFLGAERNSVRPSVAPLLAELQRDARWVAAALEMKRAFLTRQEMLVHGDLHTGSVFVRGSGDGVSVKAFDSEFACYAPIGFDLGMLWANLLFAGMRAAVLGDDTRADALFGSVETSWRVFEARFAAHWTERRDPAGYPDAFRDGWLSDILRDCFGFAGCEAARRTVGLAKVSDIETLDDAPYKAAASAMLRLSHNLLVDRDVLDAEDVAGLCRNALGAAG